jgi:hypothetical protein
MADDGVHTLGLSDDAFVHRRSHQRWKVTLFGAVTSRPSRTPWRTSAAAAPICYARSFMTRLPSASLFAHRWLALVRHGPIRAQPFVDHWDAKKTIKRSEGLMVNGREWGEWKFYDTAGPLGRTGRVQESGERDGRVRIYPRERSTCSTTAGSSTGPRGQPPREPLPRRRASWSVAAMRKNGRKTGVWAYYHPDSLPMLARTVARIVPWCSSPTRGTMHGRGHHPEGRQRPCCETYFPSGTHSQEECAYAMRREATDPVCRVPSRPAIRPGRSGAVPRRAEGGAHGNIGYSSGKPEKIDALR